MALLILSFVGILAIFSSIVMDNSSPYVIYEAEDLPSKSGLIVPDMNTSGGFYRFAVANESGAVVFGPYIRLPKGEYIASFRLKTTESPNSSEIATLDISTSKGNTIKNRTTIYAQDIEKPGSYQSFVLPFISEGENDFEFRVIKHPSGSLSVDSITISPSNVTDLYKHTIIQFIKIIIVILFGLIIAMQIRKIRLETCRDKSIILFVFTLCVYVIIILGIFGPLHEITGDEPHYLITTYSIIHDHDIYIENNYLDEDYLEFYPLRGISQHIAKTVDGRWVSVHDIGLSILLILPYYLLGVLGVRLFLAIIAAFVVVNTFIVCKEVLGDEKTALVVSLVAAFTSPLLFYSFVIYPEIIAALILVYSTMVLYKTWGGELVQTYRYMLCGIMIASMPWLGIKYVSLMLPLLLLSLIYMKNKAVYLMAIFIPILISFISYAYFMLSMFGSLSPASRYTGAIGSGVINGIPAPSFSVYNAISTSHLASYLFDQQVGLIFYSPIYILSLIGIIILILCMRNKNDLERVSVLLFPSICYFFMYAASGAFGGHSPLSRPLVAILPLIVVLMGVGLLFTSQKMMKITIDCLVVLSLVIAVLLIKNPATYYPFQKTCLLTYITNSPFVDPTAVLPSFIARNSSDNWIYLSLWLMLFIIFAVAEYIYRQKIKVDSQ